MKFRQPGQLALASAVSAALVLGITACGQSNTIDFVYVTSANANTGSVYAFASDGESGALRQIVGSPFQSGGRNPVAMLTSPNGKFLYVLNHDDNTVVEFVVGSDGKLYPQNTYNTTLGTNPTGMAFSPDGKTLYVVDAYGLDANSNPFSPTTPGIGALIQFPVGANGSLGTPAAYPTCNNPVAVKVLGDNSAVYVVNDPAGQLATLIDTVASSNRGATGNSTVVYPATDTCYGGASPKGQITSYKVSGTTLTPGDGSPFNAGVAPVGIATDPSNRFVYAIDFQTNQLISYSVQGSNGNLQPLTTSLTPTGQLPSAITIDPRGKYIYVANYNSSSVSGYALNATTGIPSSLSGSGSGAVDVGPSAIVVDPAIGRYVYTASFLGNSVAGLALNPNTGATSQVQNSPFPGVAKATAVAAVRHGDHSVQVNASY